MSPPDWDSPATASLLSKSWLRISGKDQWASAIATVYSCDWVDLEDQVNSEVGHYNVVYSYQYLGEFHAGKFFDYAMRDQPYFHRGDSFEIRYNPRNPSKSYYPQLRTRTKFVWICVGIGAALAAAAMTLSR
jgi:hypothetical protein